MSKRILSTFLLATILFANCSKEVTADTTPASDEASAQQAELQNLNGGKVVSSAHWYGTYLGVVTGGNPDGTPPDGDPDADPDSTPSPPAAAGSTSDQISVSDSNFIKNGVAELPTLPQLFTLSNISFDIPTNYSISGDSLIYEVVVKNPTTGSFYDYDVELQLTGSLHNAYLHFVADPAAQPYTSYSIGDAVYTNLSQLVNYFGDFKTIKLVLKKYGTAAYINNGLVYKFNYGTANSIGRLQTISIVGKGYAIVDNVKLTNSITNKKILSESFNVTGKSQTIFY